MVLQAHASFLEVRGVRGSNSSCMLEGLSQKARGHVALRTFPMPGILAALSLPPAGACVSYEDLQQT